MPHTDSGISYQKQTESQGDSAATTPTSGPEFVDDLRQQVHLQIVVMAQLVAIGCLSYLGDHPASTCEFVDVDFGCSIFGLADGRVAGSQIYQ